LWRREKISRTWATLLITEVWTELLIVIFVTRNRKKQLPSRDAVVCRHQQVIWPLSQRVIMTTIMTYFG